MTDTLSSEPSSTDSPPTVAGSPPSRHRSELPDRNLIQPSCASSQAERSVASGAASCSPMKGSRRNVPRLAISSPTASATICCLLPRVMSVSEGSSWFERILAYTSALRPSMCCVPFSNRHPSQFAQREGLYGQSNLLERIAFGTSTSMPPSASISSRNPSKSTTTTWSIGSPVSAFTVASVSAGPPIWFAALILDAPYPGTSTRRSLGIER